MNIGNQNNLRNEISLIVMKILASRVLIVILEKYQSEYNLSVVIDM